MCATPCAFLACKSLHPIASTWRRPAFISPSYTYITLFPPALSFAAATLLLSLTVTAACPPSDHSRVCASTEQNRTLIKCNSRDCIVRSGSHSTNDQLSSQSRGSERVRESLGRSCKPIHRSRVSRVAVREWVVQGKSKKREKMQQQSALERCFVSPTAPL